MTAPPVLLRPAGLGLPVLHSASGRAWADHPGAAGAAALDPLTVGLVAAGLALATALLVLVLVTILTRGGRTSEQVRE